MRLQVRVEHFQATGRRRSDRARQHINRMPLQNLGHVRSGFFRWSARAPDRHWFARPQALELAGTDILPNYKRIKYDSSDEDSKGDSGYLF